MIQLQPGQNKAQEHSNRQGSCCCLTVDVQVHACCVCRVQSFTQDFISKRMSRLLPASHHPHRADQQICASDRPLSRSARTTRLHCCCEEHTSRRAASVGMHPLTSRLKRKYERLIARCAGLLWSAATVAAPAQAAKQATRRDGSTVDAQEFDVDLRLVSLHKSVSQEWPFAFRQALNGRARISYERRPQLKDIVDGLKSRCVCAARRHICAACSQAAPGWPHESHVPAQPLLLVPGGHDRWHTSDVRCCRDKKVFEADAVTLGDAWLGHAIHQGLLQPISHAEQSSWWVRPHAAACASPVPSVAAQLSAAFCTCICHHAQLWSADGP